MAAKDVRFSTDARDKMLHGVDYLIMKESDIMGVLDQSAAHKKAA